MTTSKGSKEPIKLARINTVQDVYDLGGGVMQVAADLKVHSRTIERWVKEGIPERYHIDLCDLYGCTPIELYKLSLKIRMAKRAALED
jgi:transposase-like protein